MKILLLLNILFFSISALAIDEGQMRLGLQAGHVGLMQDVGGRSGNALGAGLFFGYAASDDMIFELAYLSSSHTGLNHSQVSTGVDLYYNSYQSAYFSFLGGVDFISHTLFNTSSTGFALYAGAGVDFEVGKKFGVGLEGKYHHAFETSVTASDGTSQKAIQPFATVLFRAMYFFDSKQ